MNGAFETRSGITATAEHAARELRKAEKLERREPFDPRDAVLKSLEAERARPEFVSRYLMEDLCWRLPRAILSQSLDAFARRLEA